MPTPFSRIGWTILSALALWPILCAQSQAQPAKSPDQKSERRASIPLRFPFCSECWQMEVVAISGSKSLRLCELLDPGTTQRISLIDLNEGYFVGLKLLSPWDGISFGQPFGASHLLRIKVSEIDEQGEVSIDVDEQVVANLDPGDRLLLFRPPNANTKDLKAIPGWLELAPVSKNRPAEAGQPNGAKDSHEASLSNAMRNLKRIGFALGDYQAAHGHLPPAVVSGPDGKPWHSWRVLILPYLGERALYEQYRWDEPWDGPQNRKLLTNMPAAYRQSTDGPLEEGFTSFAAITGPGTAFPANGINLKTIDAERQLSVEQPATGKARKRLDQIPDGLKYTLLVGSVSRTRMIPWMKPEDVPFSEEFPPIGQAGSFDAPFGANDPAQGVFLFADGYVQPLGRDLPSWLLKKLITIADGNRVNGTELEAWLLDKRQSPFGGDDGEADAAALIRPANPAAPLQLRLPQGISAIRGSYGLRQLSHATFVITSSKRGSYTLSTDPPLVPTYRSLAPSTSDSSRRTTIEESLRPPPVPPRSTPPDAK